MALSLADVAPFSADVMMIDPPWAFESWSDKGHTAKAAAGQYKCIPTADLCDIPLGHMAAGNAWAWIWATHPMIDDALRCMRAWGFDFVTSGVWVKRGGSGKLAFGTGYVLRCASEPFIIARVGDPPLFSKSIRTVIEAPRRQHSRKPDVAYRTAETLFGSGTRLDIFSRQERPGWIAVGDETEKFERETGDGVD
jgi:N6-adenosine-specific RNA methylase IME4